MKKPYSLLFLLTALTFTVQAQPLIISESLVQAPPPGAETLAAYMKITNPGKTTITIHQITSSDFERIEMHHSRLENGVSKMTVLKQLRIPANSSIQLQPGGQHLMLMGPRKTFHPGDLVQLQLLQTDQTKHIIEIPVKRTLSIHQH